MAVLAFDTSTAQGSVALIEGEKVLSQRSWIRERSHSEFLTAEIEAVLKEANFPAKNLRALAIGNGPGSFTGIRVAVNAAKSLGYALNLKTYVFDTNSILVEAIERTDLPVLTLINAQKNAFFTTIYKHNGKSWVESKPLALTEFDDLAQLLTEPHLCVGDGCLDFPTDSLSPDQRSRFVRDLTINDYPSAVVLGRMSEDVVKSPEALVWNAVQALYIRASGAEEKIREGLKR